jgi:hypothetical protein
MRGREPPGRVPPQWDRPPERAPHPAILALWLAFVYALHELFPPGLSLADVMPGL